MGTTDSGLVFKYAELTDRAACKDNGTFASSLTERFAHRKGDPAPISVSRVATFCYPRGIRKSRSDVP